MPYSIDDLAILGLKITFGGIDLGDVADLSFSPNTTSYEFKSTRSGRELTVKEVVIGVDLTIGFTTQNVLDAAVIALFTGGAGGAMLFEATQGALVVTRPNAETGKKQVVFNIPSASLRGTGITGTPGTEAARYQFESKALSVDGAAIGTLTAGVPAA